MPPSTATIQPAEYVLGTGADELARLALQHRLWGDAAHAAWRTARIQPGSTVLDVGCGPGFAAFDLAQLVTPSGRVVGIDESPRFIEHLKAQAACRGLHHLTALVGDVQAMFARPHPADPANPTGMWIDPATFDAAYARWVLCFVPNPAAVVRDVARALRPGGRFVVHDYFNYTSMTLAPRSEAYSRVVQATAASWKARGGDPDIVGRLPEVLADAGLSVEHLAVHQRLARGGETMFQWINVWWRTYTPKLVEMGLVSAADQRQVFADLDRVAASPGEFAVCPPVYEVVAVKR
jgi:ubiquinone/menaquinone biosynthesis C-methylase UbiE